LRDAFPIFHTSNLPRAGAFYSGQGFVPRHRRKDATASAFGLTEQFFKVVKNRRSLSLSVTDNATTRQDLPRNPANKPLRPMRRATKERQPHASEDRAEGGTAFLNPLTVSP